MVAGIFGTLTGIAFLYAAYIAISRSGAPDRPDYAPLIFSGILFLIGGGLLWVFSPLLFFRTTLRIDPRGIRLNRGWRVRFVPADEVEAIEAGIHHPIEDDSNVSPEETPRIHACRIRTPSGSSIDIDEGLTREEADWLCGRLVSILEAPTPRESPLP